MGEGRRGFSCGEFESFDLRFELGIFRVRY